MGIDPGTLVTGFGVVEENPSEKTDANTTDTNDVTLTSNEDVVRDVIRDNTSVMSDVNKNAQIEEYLKVYRRFNYTQIVKTFSKLFMNWLA